MSGGGFNFYKGRQALGLMFLVSLKISHGAVSPSACPHPPHLVQLLPWPWPPQGLHLCPRTNGVTKHIIMRVHRGHERVFPGWSLHSGIAGSQGINVGLQSRYFCVSTQLGLSKQILLKLGSWAQRAGCSSELMTGKKARQP